jgi:hypothetical protein
VALGGFAWHGVAMGATRGRPSKGSSAKTTIRSIRLTPHEAKVLSERFGSVSKALRMFVDSYFRGEKPPS